MPASRRRRSRRNAEQLLEHVSFSTLVRSGNIRWHHAQIRSRRGFALTLTLALLLVTGEHMPLLASPTPFVALHLEYLAAGIGCFVTPGPAHESRQYATCRVSKNSTRIECNPAVSVRAGIVVSPDRSPQ